MEEMFDTEEFIIAVFCCIDDLFQELTQGQPIRTRGFKPSLSDSEVITPGNRGRISGL